MSDLPRRKIDVIYQDVLAEVGPLIEKLEAITKDVDRLLTGTKNLPLDLSTAMHKSASILEKQSAQEIKEMMEQLAGIAQSTKHHAHVAEQASKKLLLLVVAAGAIAGGIGGILAGIAVGRFLFVG